MATNLSLQDKKQLYIHHVDASIQLDFVAFSSSVYPRFFDCGTGVLFNKDYSIVSELERSFLTRTAQAALLVLKTPQPRLIPFKRC